MISLCEKCEFPSQDFFFFQLVLDPRAEKCLASQGPVLPLLRDFSMAEQDKRCILRIIEQAYNEVGLPGLPTQSGQLLQGLVSKQEIKRGAGKAGLHPRFSAWPQRHAL